MEHQSVLLWSTFDVLNECVQAPAVSVGKDGLCSWEYLPLLRHRDNVWSTLYYQRRGPWNLDGCVAGNARPDIYCSTYILECVLMDPANPSRLTTLELMTARLMKALPLLGNFLLAVSFIIRVTIIVLNFR